MTDEHDSGNPWWEFDPSDKPVPLGAEGEWRLDDEAALIVASEHEAMKREDTEPTLQTILERARPKTRGPTASGVRSPRSGPRSVRRPALLLLAIGCVAMFALGWSQGAAARQSERQPESRKAPATQGSGDEVTKITPSSGTTSFAKELVVDQVQGSQEKEVRRR